MESGSAVVAFLAVKPPFVDFAPSAFLQCRMTISAFFAPRAPIASAIIDRAYGSVPGTYPYFLDSIACGGHPQILQRRQYA